MSKVGLFLGDVKTVFGIMDSDGSDPVPHDEFVQNTSMTQKAYEEEKVKPQIIANQLNDFQVNSLRHTFMALAGHGDIMLPASELKAKKASHLLVSAKIQGHPQGQP